MAVRTLSNRHLLRDLPHASVVLFYAAFFIGLAFLMVASYRSPIVQSGKTSLPSESDNGSNATRYAGSIMVEPPKGELCWQRVFDNRTGAMWDNGYVKCDQTAAQPAGADAPKSMDAKRLLEVGKAFRHAD
ncbi:MAG TPA: hypothetical protein VFA57_13655 [Pseudolabrys sp.]|nr:hypothetical protein [Pseudolabrys sp.]